MKHTSSMGSRRIFRRIAAVTLLTAVPFGLVAAPALAAPAATTSSRVIEYPWQPDCDHTGPWQWQQNRDRWEWGNCDNVHGHWEWRGEHGQEYWQWQRDFDDAPPQPAWFGNY